MKNIDEIKMLFEDNYSVVVDDVYEKDDRICVSYSSRSGYGACPERYAL